MHQTRAITLAALPILVLLCSLPWRAEAAEFALQQATSGNFYVAAVFGPVHTDMLLDTGSGYVSLTPATFRRINRSATGEARPAFKRKITGVMANGRATSVPVYQLPQLQLGDCVLENIEAVVFPGADRNILGLNALSRLQPLTLDLDGGRMVGGGCRALPAGET